MIIPQAAVALTLLVAVSGASAPPAPQPGLQAELQARYEAMRVAMASRNAANVAALLAPNFSSVDVRGRRETAADMITEVTGLKPDPRKVSTTTLSNVRLGGTSVTLDQQYDMKSQRLDEAGVAHPIEIVARSTDTWVRLGGVWLMQQTVTKELSVWRDGKLVAHQLSPKP